MRLWDTAGQEDYERLRILAYEGVDVVIMAFSLVNKNSFDNISDKWLPEYRQHLSGVPVRTSVDKAPEIETFTAIFLDHSCWHKEGHSDQ